MRQIPGDLQLQKRWRGWHLWQGILNPVNRTDPNQKNCSGLSCTFLSITDCIHIADDLLIVLQHYLPSARLLQVLQPHFTPEVFNFLAIARRARETAQEKARRKRG